MEMNGNIYEDNYKRNSQFECIVCITESVMKSQQREKSGDTLMFPASSLITLQHFKVLTVDFHAIEKCSDFSAGMMLLPVSLLIGLLCLSHVGGVTAFARLLDDAELRSAFSVARTNSMEGGPKMTVTFDTTYVNIGGDFDPKAGLLRCRIPGAYYFSFTVGKFPHKDLSVMLMKNRNEVQAIVYEENAGEERKVAASNPRY